MRLRPALKNVFDRVVYKYPLINRILRNINKQLSGVTSFRLRPIGIMQVRFKSGIHFKMATNETSSVTKLLFWNGPDNYEYTGIFERLLSQTRTFIDVGANTGYYALLAGVKNPTTSVYAFEPASAPYFYLDKNIRINNLKNVKAFQLALSDTEGEIEFFEIDNPENYHSKYNLAGTGSLKSDHMSHQRFVTRKVPTTLLDRWVAVQAISNIDLVKIDTEGTEHLILRGADKVLREQQPIIICETLFNVIEEELEKIMRLYDYRFYNYSKGKLYRTETLIRKTDDGFRDCFFVPKNKISWIQPFVE